MSVAKIRIPVERRFGGFFAGDVPIAFSTDGALSADTRRALGYEWEYALRLRQCQFCAGFFIGHYSARICCDLCAKGNRQNWELCRYGPARLRPVSKSARRRSALAAAVCEQCDVRMGAKRLTARFCSGRCRQKNYRKCATFREEIANER